MSVYRISHAPRFVISTKFGGDREGAPAHIARQDQSGYCLSAPQSMYADALPLDEVIRLMDWAYDCGVRDAQEAMRAAIGMRPFDEAPRGGGPR